MDSNNKLVIMKKVTGFITISLIIASIFSGKAFSQIKEGKSLDKIVAVVGNEIIMKSEVDGYIMAMAQQQPDIDPNDPEIREKVLNNLIDENLVVTKAIEDSVVVTDEEVNQRVDFMISNWVSHYGSEKRVENIMGISLSKLKQDYKELFRKKLLAEKLKQQKFSDITVSPREVKEFYEAHKDTLPQIPPQVKLYQIVKYIEADKDAREETVQLAKRVRDSIIAGGDFAEFAKRYSDDPMTREDGGELGWFEKGKLYPAFEQAAFSLQEDEISLPVETPFGFHIIQTMDKEKNRVFTRHILFKVGETTKDKEKVKDLLTDIKKRVEEGESFRKLAKKYSDDKQTRGFGGKLGKLPLNELPGEMKKVVMDMPEGGVTEPMEYTGDPTKKGYYIIYKKEFYPAHKPNLEDDYEKIEQFAKANKQSKMFEDWIDELRAEMYWEIKKE